MASGSGPDDAPERTRYGRTTAPPSCTKANVGAVRNLFGSYPSGGVATLLRGFATINYWAADLVAAKKWNADVLGVEPYFERAELDGRIIGPDRARTRPYNEPVNQRVGLLQSWPTLSSALCAGRTRSASSRPSP